MGINAGPQPSDSSMQEMLDLLHVRDRINSTLDQISTNPRSDNSEKKLSPKSEKIIREMHTEQLMLAKSEDTWKSVFRQEIIDIFRQSLTQQDVDSINTFLKSEAGKKLPYLSLNMDMKVIQDSQAFANTKAGKALAVSGGEIENLDPEVLDEIKAFGASDSGQKLGALYEKIGDQALDEIMAFYGTDAGKKLIEISKRYESALPNLFEKRMQLLRPQWDAIRDKHIKRMQP